VAGSSEHGNELSGSIKGRKFDSVSSSRRTLPHGVSPSVGKSVSQSVSQAEFRPENMDFVLQLQGCI
jgi:hypothetical protein